MIPEVWQEEGEKSKPIAPGVVRVKERGDFYFYFFLFEEELSKELRGENKR